MNQLIMTMIAILLFVGVVTGGINYVNQDAMTISKEASVLNSAYMAVKADIANYSIKQPEPPSSLVQVYPSSSFYPGLPGKMSLYSLTKLETADIYVCIKIEKTPINYGASLRLQQNRSTERIYQNDQCGETSNQNYDNLGSNYYLTIFM